MSFYVVRIIMYAILAIGCIIISIITNAVWPIIPLVFLAIKIVLFWLVCSDMKLLDTFSNVIVLQYKKFIKFYEISPDKYTGSDIFSAKYYGDDDKDYYVYFKSLIDYIKYWYLYLNIRNGVTSKALERYTNLVREDLDKFYDKSMKQLEEATKKTKEQIKLTLDSERTAK